MSPRSTNFHVATTFASALIFGLLSLLWLGKPTPITHAQPLPEALGSISGVVRNAQGDPLPNVQVTLLQDIQGSNIRQATTDAQGEYTLLSVPPGGYKVRFEDNGKVYATEYYDNATRWSTASEVNVSGNSLTDINAQLAPGGTISITLKPTPSVGDTLLILTLYARTPTNRWELVDTLYWPNDAELTFYGVPNGRYTVCVQNTPLVDNAELGQCYQDKLRESYIQPPVDAKEILIEGTSKQQITLNFGGVSQLQGVVKSSSGQPLANIQMYLETSPTGQSFLAITDAQGHFAFSFVQENTYRLRMDDNSKAHLLTYYENALTLVQAKPIEILASSRYSLTLTMQRAGSITGTIRAPGGGIPTSVTFLPMVPLPDGSWDEYYGICYFDTCFPTYEPTTGVYTITGMTTGRYRLKVTEGIGRYNDISGYYGGNTLQEADDIFVSTGETTPNINIVLDATNFEGSIRGRTTANGVPQAGIEVGVFRQGYDIFNQPTLPLVSTQTDAQGDYRFDGLPNGNYMVGFYDPTGKYALTFYGNDLAQPPTVGITGTMTVENINAELTPGGTIRGSIQRARGENPADFAISIRVISFRGLQSFGGVLPFAQITSDVNGNFEIKGLPLGTYRIAALSPDDLPYPSNFHFYPFGLRESPQGDILVRANSVVTGINIPIDIEPSAYLPIIGGVGEVSE